MAGINLHDVVRAAITSVHPDETVKLYQSTGQSNVAGLVTPTYAAAQTVAAQIQSANNADLEHINYIGLNKVVMRFWLYAGTPAPAGIVRPFSRNGDMLQLEDGTWWLVTGEPDNFDRVGWVSVLAVLQEYPPAGLPKDDEEETPGGA